MHKNILDLRNNCEKAEKFFLKKLAFTLGPIELKKMNNEENVKIIDVRMRSDFETGHIPGAICIPYEDLENELPHLNKEDLHIVYCYNNYCHLSAHAAYLLAKNSYPVMELCGGFKTWSEEFKFPVAQ